MPTNAEKKAKSLKGCLRFKKIVPNVRARTRFSQNRQRQILFFLNAAWESKSRSIHWSKARMVRVHGNLKLFIRELHVLLKLNMKQV
jgi:hypothetical protein